jgi:hypothetical protein
MHKYAQNGLEVATELPPTSGHAGLSSSEWRRWIIGNKLLRRKDEQLIAVLQNHGVGAQKAARDTAEVTANPFSEVGVF